MNDVIDFINTHRDRYVDELKQYLAIPSISALPEHADDVKRCAEWTAEELGRVGLENVRVIETPGNPVVYADWVHADVHRPFSSTGTTTFSPSTQLTNGNHRRLRRLSAMERSMLGERPTTRDRSSCTSKRSKPA